jgi:hypothetical protein
VKSSTGKLNANSGKSNSGGQASTASQTALPHSDRPPSTLSSAPSQPTLEALAALLKIEIKFAALRDQLYIERMNEITKEEEMVVNGTSISYSCGQSILTISRGLQEHTARWSICMTS